MAHSIAKLALLFSLVAVGCGRPTRSVAISPGKLATCPSVDSAKELAEGARAKERRSKPHAFGAAIGGQGGKSVYGKLLVDIRDKGADPTGSATNAEIAIQKAIHDLQDQAALVAGTINTKPGTVWVPSGTYLTSKPIWLDGEGINLIGESRDASRIVGLHGGPLVIMGHRPRAAWNREVRSAENILIGSASFTSGATAVTGVGTNFRFIFGNFLAETPDVFVKPAGGPSWYRVASVESDTHLTLTSPFSEASTTGQYIRGVDYLKRIPNVFAADHRMDLFGKLDTSIVNAPGQRFGVTSKSPTAGSPFADHWLAFPFSPASTGKGDCYDAMRSLTIDFAAEGASVAGGSLQGYLFGMGAQTQPGPWFLTAISGPYEFDFYTKEGVRDSFGSPRTFSFGDSTTATGMQRISVQIDFTTNNASGLCDLRAWINGVEQTVTRGYGTSRTAATSTEPSFTAADNLHWQSSEPGGLFSFYQGSGSELSWNVGSYQSSRGKYSLYGFRLSDVARYTTAGGVQARIDAGVLNDAYRYSNMVDGASLICSLDTTAPRVGDYDGRLVPLIGPPSLGSTTFYGLFLWSEEDEGTGSETTAGFIKNNLLENLYLQGGNRGSAIVWVGPCLNPNFRNLKLNATEGWVGLGGNVPSVYDVRISNCEIGDTRGAWIIAQGWITEIQDLWRASTGRYALRFDGCSVKCRNVRMGDLQATEAYVKITGNGAYGSQYIFDTIDSDNEGQPFPSLAFLYCERHNAGLTTLECTNFNPGSIPDAIPMVKLVDRYPLVVDGTPGQGKFHGYNILMGRLGVETDGPGWEGFVDNVFTTPSGINQWRKHTGPDGQSNVIVHHRLDTLPTGGTWQKNAHLIELRHPTSGQAFRYLCTKSGTMGVDDPIFTPIGPTLP